MSDVQVFGAARGGVVRDGAARDGAARDGTARDGTARDRAARSAPRPGCRDVAAEPAAGALRPRGLQDLRQGRSDRDRPAPPRRPSALHYPEGDLLVVSGLPGSGKSTLMRRCVRAPIVDSQLVREEYAARLPSWLPYAVYRPVVRFAHYRRLRRAVLAGGPLTVHDCGAVPYVRRWLARAAERQGRRVHLILLDASAEEARDGQRARGQAVSAYAFARHRDAAWRLRRRLAGTGRPPTGCASAVVLDRAGARALREIVFVAS